MKELMYITKTKEDIEYLIDNILNENQIKSLGEDFIISRLNIYHLSFIVADYGIQWCSPKWCSTCSGGGNCFQTKETVYINDIIRKEKFKILLDESL